MYITLVVSCIVLPPLYIMNVPSHVKGPVTYHPHTMTDYIMLYIWRFLLIWNRRYFIRFILLFSWFFWFQKTKRAEGRGELMEALHQTHRIECHNSSFRYFVTLYDTLRLSFSCVTWWGCLTITGMLSGLASPEAVHTRILEYIWQW